MEPWDLGDGIDRCRCDPGADAVGFPPAPREDVRGVRLVGHWSGPVRKRPPLVAITRSFRIRVERFCNERLGYLWSVGVSGIEQVHSQFKGAVQDSDGFLLISWWSPDARACEAHCAEAETIHCQVSANGKLFHWL